MEVLKKEGHEWSEGSPQPTAGYSMGTFIRVVISCHRIQSVTQNVLLESDLTTFDVLSSPSSPLKGLSLELWPPIIHSDARINLRTLFLVAPCCNGQRNVLETNPSG